MLLEHKVCIASCVCLVASLFFPVFVIEGNPDNNYPGIEVLFLGWAGIFDGFIIAWFATPMALLASIILIIGSIRLARWLSILSIVLALDSLRFTSIPGPQVVKILAPAAGEYLWFAFLFLTLLACLIAKPTEASEFTAS